LYKKKLGSFTSITYTLLYHLGLRLNEIRTLEIQDILQGIERQELRITLFKTNRSHNATLSSCAVGFKKLNVEFNFIQEE
jgi:integrase